MPEIKIKHIVSFSSEDTVYKAENLLKPETFRKWKCATSAEKNATVVLQFVKSSQIQSVDIGNDHSAFIEVLVGRSSDSTNDYQVLLSASSFMSPLESRNSTNSNRVRMFGSEKFPPNVKNEKWDCVQIICTQPFNKNVQYGLSFVKFHSVPDPSMEAPVIQKKEQIKLGAFKLNEDDDSELPVGSWFLKRNEKTNLSATNPAAIRGAVCTAGNTNSISSLNSQKSLGKKRKLDDGETSSALLKKKDSAHSNSGKGGHKHVDTNQSNGASKSPPVLAGPPTNVPNSPPVTKKPTTNTIEHKGQKKKRKKSFSQIMERVVFAISGFQNPHRGEIRERATEMGARYKGDWDSACTHLICAFVNTPKYILVRGQGGRIVSKNWIYDCHKRKELLPWRKYMLGQYSKSTTEEEDTSEDEALEVSKVSKKEAEERSMEGSSRMNGSLVLPSTSKSLDSEPPLQKSEKRKSEEKVDETNVDALDDDDDDDDTNAESDYLAATDVDSSSDGDTEDEIRRVKQGSRNMKKQISPKKTNGDILDASDGTLLSDSSAVLSTKPNTDGLNLPVLPDFFKNRKFFLYGDFSEQEKHDLQRYITAYNGFIVDYMSKDVKYVITLSKWNSDFDEGLSENEDLTFVRPQWIYKCHEKGKFIPFQPHIVIPGL